MRKSPNGTFFLLFGITLFLFQPLQYGFELGGHLGWVGSHGAGLMTKASPENFLVGHSLSFENAGEKDYMYFDRYPFIFSAFFSAVLRPFESDRIDLWVFLSRQLMNLIFLATVFFGYRVLRHFTVLSQNQRIAVTALVFSGHYYLEYKAMLHFDQVAILGMVALLDQILAFQKARKANKSLWFWGIFAPLLGRGYSSLFMMVGWNIFELIRNAKAKSLARYFLSTPLMLLIVSGSVCTSFLTYNIVVESYKRDIPIAQVSIVQSAARRLGIHETTSAKNESLQVSWLKFTNKQLSRFVHQLTPYSLNYQRNVRTIFFIIAALFFIYSLRSFLRACPEREKSLWLFTFLTGPIWVFPMKQLTYFHEYTSMFYFGFSMLFFSTLVNKLGERKYILPLALVIAASSLGVRYYEGRKDLAQINAITYEFMEIRNHLADDHGASIFIPEGHREILSGRPYSMGFYLHEYYIARQREGADYILSKNKQNETNITPLYEGNHFSLYQLN